MKSIALLLSRFLATFRVEPGSTDAILCGETVGALAEFYGGGPIPAFDIPLIEELFLHRFLAARFESHLGERGLFAKKGDDPHGALHPAVNAAIRARSRYATIMRDLAKRHRDAQAPAKAPAVERGSSPSREAAIPSRFPSVPEPAPNGHAVALPAEPDAGDFPSPAPTFVNRAMRRLTERDAARAAKKEAKAGATTCATMSP